jgi:hypothetical protein
MLYRIIVIICIFLFCFKGFGQTYKLDTSKYVVSRYTPDNTYATLKVPDTIAVQLKVFDSLGYMKRMRVYKVVYERCFKNAIYTPSGFKVSDYRYEYYYPNMTKIRKEDYEENSFLFQSSTQLIQ